MLILTGSVELLDIHSCPTRRSSDLSATGVITKSGGTGTSNFGNNAFSTFNNAGQVNVNSGTLSITAPGTHTGIYSIASGKTDRKSTRMNSSHRCTSYAVFCVKEKSG